MKNKVKILTVDDSKSIRFIIAKAFKEHEVELLEAENGSVGLELAKTKVPDIILLDITMPVMDGIEMLCKLKENLATKQIPVIMLTAEGSKDKVVKVAKIGIRDYIVKPFEEATLVDKVNRVVPLTKKTPSLVFPKSLQDPCRIFILEEKETIIQQLKEAMTPINWTIEFAHSPEDALQHCARFSPHVVIVSLSLPEQMGLNFIKLAKKFPHLKHSIFLSLAVKTDTISQDKASQLGYLDCIYKPIILEDVEKKIMHSLKLNLTHNYYSQTENALVIKIPENDSKEIIHISHTIDSEITQAVDDGLTCIVMDLNNLNQLSLTVIKLICEAEQICQKLSLNFLLIASPDLLKEAKKTFQEVQSWSALPSLEEALATLTQTHPSPDNSTA